MDSQLAMILLRAFHVMSGVFWVGAITLLARFVVPVSRSRERDPGGVLGVMFGERRLGLALAGAGLVTVVTGMFLYRPYFGQPWNLASPGPVELFGLGGVLAMVALIIGASYGIAMFVTLRRAPDHEDPAVFAARGRRVAILSRTLAALLVPATILMAIARYT